MKLEQLRPKTGSRVFFTGQTGSGKSTLARILLSSYQHVVIYDGKGDVDWKGYTTHTSLRSLVQDEKATRFIYQPDIKEVSNQESIEKFFEWIYLRRHTLLYVDEIYSITIGSQIPFWYHACLTRGRALGISVWSGSQRPMLIPSTVLSESENAFIFKLSMPKDRDKVQSIYTIDADSIGALDKETHQFYAIKKNSDLFGPFSLKIR